MIKYTFTKFTKWSVLKKLIFQEIDDLIAEADVDGDGQIGYDEFKRLIIHL